MVSEERLERLWNHLLEVEKQTGMPLRETPRYTEEECPMGNFAPEYDKMGYQFAVYNTTLMYWGKLGESQSLIYNKYPIYEESDESWWRGLLLKERREVTNWVIRKLKERE